MGLPRAKPRGEQRPFGCYRITRLADGRAVGVIGFKGQPDGGCVDIAYGLALGPRPRLRRGGSRPLLAMAAGHGVSRVIADTALR